MSRLLKICQSTPLLPVLVGILTVVSMFSANAGRLGWGQLWSPLVFVILWAVVCWFIIWIFPKGRRVSGIIAGVTVFVTMLWGIFPQIPKINIPIGDIVPFLVWLVAGALVIRFYKAVNKALPIVTLIIAVAIVVSLGQATISIARTGNSETDEPIIIDIGGNHPDIYFIVPDRFGSPDALRESGLSEVNVSWFVQELRDRGFYVREDALSSDTFEPGDRAVSTTRTLRYLASVLNFGEDIDLNINYNEAGQMVRHPEVVRVLRTMGYTCYNVGSWYPETAICRIADHNYVYEASNPVQWLYVQEFGAAVLDRSIWRYFTITGNQTERDRQVFQFQAVAEIASNGIHPQFTFVHILLPHPPFIWTADGEPQEGGADMMTLYLEQVQFTESYLLEMIDSISDNAIIIIQSDEGVCFTQSGLNDGLSNTQWNGVLMAWRIPDADVAELEGIGYMGILGFVISLIGGE